MFAPEMIAISSWSYARSMNLAKVEQNGIFPAAAAPAATEIMFCSAILHSRYCAGHFLANHSACVEFFTSQSRPMMRLSAAPSATSAAPYALRGARGLPALRSLSRPTIARPSLKGAIEMDFGVEISDFTGGGAG